MGKATPTKDGGERKSEFEAQKHFVEKYSRKLERVK
jgi:hypothetical protein